MVVLLTIFVKAMIYFFHDSLINIKFERKAFISNKIKIYDTVNVFTVTFNQLNAYLVDTHKMKTADQRLIASVYCIK